MNNAKPVFGTNDYAHPGSYSAWNMDPYHRVVMPVDNPISYEDFSTTDRPELRKKLPTTSLSAQAPFEPMIQLSPQNLAVIEKNIGAQLAASVLTPIVYVDCWAFHFKYLLTFMSHFHKKVRAAIDLAPNSQLHWCYID